VRPAGATVEVSEKSAALFAVFAQPEALRSSEVLLLSVGAAVPRAQLAAEP
jgi:hypothetical protein